MSDWTLLCWLLIGASSGYALYGVARCAWAAMKRSVAEDDAGSGRWLIR